MGGEYKARGILMFNYPSGNPAAKKQQEENAARIQGDYLVITCPRNPVGNWPAVEKIDGDFTIVPGPKVVPTTADDPPPGNYFVKDGVFHEIKEYADPPAAPDPKRDFRPGG